MFTYTRMLLLSVRDYKLAIESYVGMVETHMGM